MSRHRLVTPPASRTLTLGIAILMGMILLTLPQVSWAKMGAKEHKSHHPGAAESDVAATSDSGMGMGSKGGKASGMGGKKAGGMGKGMKGMMQAMARPKSTELFPLLIKLPQISGEERATFLVRAQRRETEGIEQLQRGFGRLTLALGRDDFVEMRAEAAVIEEGLSRFRSGLAVRQALKEGVAPQRTALKWYKSQLNLLPPAAMHSSFRLFGMSAFSLFICFFSLLIGLTLVAIYLIKVRRTSVLLERLATASIPQAAPPVVRATPVEKVAPVVRAAPAAKVSPASSDSAGCCSHADGDRVSDAGLLDVEARKLCRLRVVRIYQETPEVKTFRMVACDGAAIPFSYQPGQFLTLSIPHEGKIIRRNYTISSSPTQGYYCEITVKREEQGIGSRYLHDVLQEGDTLEVQPPAGHFIFTGKEAKSIVLIGGGVGVTPMMSVARAMLDIGWNGELYFIYACRTLQEFIFADEMKILKRRNPKLKTFIVVGELDEPQDEFYTGQLTAKRLAAWVPEITDKRIHLCGSPPMMDALKNMLTELGVTKEQIKFEMFGPSKSSAKPAVETSERPVVKAAGTTIKFKRSGKSGQLQADETVLEAAERLGVEIDSSCRAGSCGICAVKLLEGQVDMACEDGLHPEDKAQGMILACQATALSDLTIEA